MNKITYIESLENPRIKTALRLRTRRGRSSQERILVDGLREIDRGTTAGVEWLEIFRRETLTAAQSRVWQRIAQSNAQPFTLSSKVFRKLAFGERDEGIVAVGRFVREPLANWSPGERDLILVLDSIEKPGNLGAVFRTADAAGVDGVVVTGSGTDLSNPNAIRASLGTVFAVRSTETTAVEAADWLAQHNFRVWVARLDGALDYRHASYDGRTAIVLGSEDRGVSPDWRVESTTGIAVPMLGVADSLNVSVTAAVVAYEALRQRSAPDSQS